MGRDNPYIDRDLKEYVFEEYGTITYAITVTAKSEGEAWEKFHCGDHDSHDEIEYNCGDVELVDPEPASVSNSEDGYIKRLRDFQN